MKPHFCEGAAGTGKTSWLMTKLEEVLVERPLGEQQHVLALSKMHGSRRRLTGRLTNIKPLRRRFDCVTIDSFARRLVIRWRSLARVAFGVGEPETFDEWCGRASALLQKPVVHKWVAAAYPVVLVDEIQDSKGEQMGLLQALATSSLVLWAGDAFQDLDAGNNAAIAWARTHSHPTVLATVHRTRVPALLAGADALRAGDSLSTGIGLEVVDVPQANLGAWHAAKFIAGRKRGENLALISPASAAASGFVRELVDRVGSGPIGKQKKFGPYKLPWEQGRREEYDQLIDGLGLSALSPDVMVKVSELPSGDDTPTRRMAATWFDRQRRLHGRAEFRVGEIRKRMERLLHDAWARRTTSRLFAAMTVHQAKNREFDNVVVLWPYEVAGSPEKKRRLLYNAVTRARRRAIVIVQNNPARQNRLNEPPFKTEQAPSTGGLAARGGSVADG